MTIQNIVQLIDQHKLEEAWEQLTQLPDNEKTENLLLGGKIKMMQQQFGEALNLYSKVLEIEPDNSEAKSKINSIRGILNISNSFYFENTYLDDGLYEYWHDI